MSFPGFAVSLLGAGVANFSFFGNISYRNDISHIRSEHGSKAPSESWRILKKYEEGQFQWKTGRAAQQKRVEGGDLHGASSSNSAVNSWFMASR
jgi:hypothetical protein